MPPVWEGVTAAKGGLMGMVAAPALTAALKPLSLLVGAVLALSILGLRSPIALLTGWRSYDRDENSVGREYDAWTREKILEHYWGEHIHLGYYSDEVQQKVREAGPSLSESQRRDHDVD
jgi:hypothetical protein